MDTADLGGRASPTKHRSVRALALFSALTLMLGLFATVAQADHDTQRTSDRSAQEKRSGTDRDDRSDRRRDRDRRHADVASVRFDDEDRDATNDTGTQHTVNVTARDHQDRSVQGAEILFEVYRPGAEEAREGRDSRDRGNRDRRGRDRDRDRDQDRDPIEPVHSQMVVTDKDGRATFSYTGPEIEADDIIYACVYPEGDEPETCSCDGDAEELREDLVGDRTMKYWREPAPEPDRVANVVIDEEDRDSINEVGTEHSVSVTATDVDGEPVEGAEILFEVYREEAEDENAENGANDNGNNDDSNNNEVNGTNEDGTNDNDTNDNENDTNANDENAEPVESEVVITDEDGRATFTYIGPEEEAHDTIFACTNPDGTAPETCSEDGLELTGGVVGDHTTKQWEVDDLAFCRQQTVNLFDEALVLFQANEDGEPCVTDDGSLLNEDQIKLVRSETSGEDDGGPSATGEVVGLGGPEDPGSISVIGTRTDCESQDAYILLLSSGGDELLRLSGEGDPLPNLALDDENGIFATRTSEEEGTAQAVAIRFDGDNILVASQAETRC